MIPLALPSPRKRADFRKPIKRSCWRWRVVSRMPGEARLYRDKEDEHDFILKFWDWLEPTGVHRLCAAWDRQVLRGDRIKANHALVRLREMHVSSIRAELAHVHPSWLVRALQEESPAVKRVVAASVPESLRHAIQAGLLLDSQDLVTERPVHPMFRDWVMGLWTERLVGGEAARDDDPPALLAICGLSPRDRLPPLSDGWACQDRFSSQKSPDKEKPTRPSASGLSGFTAASPRGLGISNTRPR